MFKKKSQVLVFVHLITGLCTVTITAQQNDLRISEIQHAILQEVACNRTIKRTDVSIDLQKPPTSLPIKDITFAIADLKFNPETNTIKLLECGDGARSKYMGYDRLHGIGSLWAQFWNYLHQFNLPTWCIRMPGDPASRQTMAPDIFFSLGGKCTTGIADLQRRILSDIFEQKQAVSLQECFDYQALTLIRWGRAAQAMSQFKAIFPNVLFVGDPINEIIRNKYHTNQLFIDTELQQYRPKCIVCPLAYTPDLANTIISELQSDIVVIKPTNASKGRGVILVEKENLDSTLQLILGHPDQIENKDPDSSFGYWASDECMENTIFLAEEYISSKIVSVTDGVTTKEYDPTLRLIFALHKDEQGCHVTFFDGYWKLPAKALSEEGTLTEKHKSDISANSVSSAALSAEDFEKSTSLLQPALLKLYSYILQNRRLRFGNLF